MSSAQQSDSSAAIAPDSDNDEANVASIMGFASFGKSGPSNQSAGSFKAKKTREQQKKSKTAVLAKSDGADNGGKELPTDYMKVFEDSLRLARERNQQKQQSEESGTRSAMIGPSLPPVDYESAAATAEKNLTDVLDKKKKSKKEKKEKKAKKEKKHKKKDKKDDDKTSKPDSEDDEEMIGPAIPDCFKAASIDCNVDGNNASEAVAAHASPSDDVDEILSAATGKEENVEKDEDDGDDDDDKDDELQDEEADNEEEDDALRRQRQDQQQLFVPRTNQISLDHRTGKPVVALGLDSSGARVVTGGSDFSVRYWNFSGMDSSCRPFKMLDQPCGAHQIRFVGFNSTSDCVLVASGSAQLRLHGREGKLLAESVKGYQYISNPRSTPGHTHALLGACWHPRDGAEFLTCSMDNSVRLWDPNNTEKILQETRLKSCKEVIVPKSAQGRAVVPSACAYTPDGNQVYAGCIDGSIQAWDRRRRFVNTSQLIRSAHGADTLTSLAFSYDGVCLLSRSMDDTLKLWDIRRTDAPLFLRSDLSTQFEQTSCGFAPNDRLFFTTTSAPAKICEKDGRSPGQLLFFDRLALSSSSSSAGATAAASAAPASSTADVLTCNFDSGIIRCLWHAKINQLLLSTADGRVLILFDDKRSVNGAKLCSAKPAKRSLDQDALAYRGGYVRESLLTYDEETMREVRQGKRKSKFYELESANAARGQRKVYQAEAPLSGPGYGGKLGQKGATLHQYMLQQMVRKRGDDPAEKDIRGAILRHNEEAQRNPMWTGVYAKTQPVPVFQDVDADEQSEATPDNILGGSSTDEAKKRRLE